KKSTEATFVVDAPDAPTQAFLIEKDSKRFPQTGGWGYALFNHDTATGKMTADEAKSDCGHVCHVAVKAKDYIFHPYQKRRTACPRHEVLRGALPAFTRPYHELSERS